MLTIITPHLQLDSVLELDRPRLLRLGLQGLLLDVDCTLKDHGQEAFSPAVAAWVQSLRADGVRLCLFSNGRARRIEGLARSLDVPFVAKALKPLPFACAVGLKLLGLSREQSGLVGDQLFADVMAGRLAGLFTILVRPTSTHEPWFTRVKRPVERLVLRRLNAPPRTQVPVARASTKLDTAPPEKGT
jgi:HAD superfamily phosphatase (TIGR01668 family)